VGPFDFDAGMLPGQAQRIGSALKVRTHAWRLVRESLGLMMRTRWAFGYPPLPRAIAEEPAA
jgi:hypothetical protein